MEEILDRDYSDLVVKSGLADYSPVRGMMIIKPYGYALWENMQQVLDQKFKATGHQNVYFPLFIPKRFLAREVAHIEGFAKECAVVTHYRLKATEEGIVVDEDAKLEEELIVRPTSETIIWSTYKEWIESYRDLPLLLNQWANVVRWEMRTRLFLRTSEFLWQEGHTAHASKEEAIAESKLMLEVYADFIEQYLAIPVVRGVKSASERFAGADETYCVEVLLRDGKALQAGTAHFLGQNFAKAFDVTFLDKDNQRKLVWATSWGVSTRLIGALIMAHSDKKGLVLPPKLAPIQVVIIPIGKLDEKLQEAGEKIAQDLRASGLRVHLDIQSQRPGWKFAEYELKGVPLRINLGPRELERGQLELVRRDNEAKELINLEQVADKVAQVLQDIQENLFAMRQDFLQQHTTEVENMQEFIEVLDSKGGFISAHWDGTQETEAKIKELTKATLRCIPLQASQEQGKCVLSGRASTRRVLFARAY